MSTTRKLWLMTIMLAVAWSTSHAQFYSFDVWVEAEGVYNAYYREPDIEGMGYYTYKGHYAGEIFPDDGEYDEETEEITSVYYIHGYFDGEFYGDYYEGMDLGRWISLDPPIGPLKSDANGNLMDENGNIVAYHHYYTHWVDYGGSWDSVRLSFTVTDNGKRTCEVSHLYRPDTSFLRELCHGESDVYDAWLYSISIPETVTTYENGSYITYTVTGIGDRAFQPQGTEDVYIGRVDLPATIKTIGDRAFADFGSFQFALPPHLEYIGDYAFMGCYCNSDNETLYLPASVRHIGKDAFADCNLSSIEVAPENPVYDSREDCNAIIETATNTLLTGSLGGRIPKGVWAIADHAFLGCRLANLELPVSLVSIGEYAFGDGSYRYDGILPYEDTSGGQTEVSPLIPKHHQRTAESGGKIQRRWGEFSTVIIPEQVTSISKGAFYYCDLDTVTSMITTPFPIEDNVFNYSTKEYGVLLVPASSVAQYETTDGWKDFCQIEGLDGMNMGDVNGDGKVNVLDLAALVNYINGKIPAIFIRDAANMWKDSKINVQDLVCLVAKLMDLGEGRRFMRSMHNVTQDPMMAEANVSFRDGQLLVDSKKNISAFDIIIDDTSSFQISQTLRQMGMTCQTRQTDSQVHLIGYSLIGGLIPAGAQILGMIGGAQPNVSKAMLADQEAMEIITSINSETTSLELSKQNADASNVYQMAVGSDAVIQIKADGSKYLKKHYQSSKESHR